MNLTSVVDLGVSMRMKYGFLLKVCYLSSFLFKNMFSRFLQNFTDTNTLPVFRTESQYLTIAFFCIIQWIDGTI
jgi:hypothetical protein